MGETLLSVRNIEAGYGDIQVFGASTLMSTKGRSSRSSDRTARASTGSIMFAGNEIKGASPDAIVARGISHVPEGRRLFKSLSVRDNLLLGAFHRKAQAEVAADLEFVFDVFPILRERASQDATTLSGGEQQMCAMGRGFMARPSLLIIDELSLGLAPSMVELLAESLVKFKEKGMSILLVEQDVVTALEVSDYGYVLESGRVAIHGSPDHLLKADKIRDSYLGI